MLDGSIAVGSSGFVEETRDKLGISAIGRKIEKQPGDLYVLREPPDPTLQRQLWP